jgi:hypothetical protein
MRPQPPASPSTAERPVGVGQATPTAAGLMHHEQRLPGFLPCRMRKENGQKAAIPVRCRYPDSGSARSRTGCPCAAQSFHPSAHRSPPAQDAGFKHFKLQSLEQEVRPPHHLVTSQHINIHLHVQQLVAVRSCPPARGWRGACVAEGYAFLLKPSAAARQELGTVDTAAAAAEVWVQVTLSFAAGASSAASRSAGNKLRADTAPESDHPDPWTPPPRRRRQRTCSSAARCRRRGPRPPSHPTTPWHSSTPVASTSSLGLKLEGAAEPPPLGSRNELRPIVQSDVRVGCTSHR